LEIIMNKFFTTGRALGLSAIAAVVVAAGVVVAAPSQAAPNGEQGTTALLAVSAKSDRSNPESLDKQTLSGTKWIYLRNPGDVENVVFFVDQPNFDQIHKVETNKPFDLMGTKADGNSQGLDTKTLKDGTHTVSAVLLGKNQSVSKVSATFTIKNAGATPAPPASNPTPPASEVPPTELPEPVNLKASLSGAAEVPGPGDNNGTGSFEATIDQKQGTICYSMSVKNVSKITDVHIHRAAAGQEGAVVAPLLAPGNTDIDACVSINKDVASRILANPANYYVNVHTTEFAKGAVRGQLSN
jgi:hypothetical protein